MAQRFFGDVNPVGKQLMMDKTPYLVRGVFEKNPKCYYWSFSSDTDLEDLY